MSNLCATKAERHHFEEWWKANSCEANYFAKNQAFTAFLAGRQSLDGKIIDLRSMLRIVWRHWKEERDDRLDLKAKTPIKLGRKRNHELQSMR